MAVEHAAGLVVTRGKSSGLTVKYAPLILRPMHWSSRTRTLRVRQLLLSAALITPVLVAIASTPPFSAAPRAQSGSNMVGPAFPIMTGGERIVPIRTGNTVSYPTKWSCGDTASHTLTLANPDGTGRFRTVTRELGSLHQDLTITALSGGAPQQFVLTETREGVVVHTTTATVVDLNSDGVMDALTFTGQYNATISLVHNGGNVSIPWSEASTLGIDTSYPCGGILSQVWIPLADTNADGRGDSVVLDLDGNGVADGDLYASPLVAAPSVPTMGPMGRLFLMLLIALIGGWFLSRHRADAPGTPV